MQQHIDFPISVLNFKLGNLMKNLVFRIAFLNDQNTLVINSSHFGCHMSRLPFRAVGSGWQWISEGLNYVRFLFKFVT